MVASVVVVSLELIVLSELKVLILNRDMGRVASVVVSVISSVFPSSAIFPDVPGSSFLR